MSSWWNYRVVRRVVGDQVDYGIHEAYYQDEKVTSITESPVPIVEDDLETLRWTLSKMLMAAEKPVLDYETMQELPKESGEE